VPGPSLHPMSAFIKRLVLWFFLAVPVGTGAGVAVSLWLPADAAVDRFTAAGNGAIAGFALGVFGAVAAAATLAATRTRLCAAGGSECLSGAIIAYGLVAFGLVFLLLVG
jgi:hypothetical protein